MAKSYEERKEAERLRRAEQSRSSRDIGSIPPIANPNRREDCRRDLRQFPADILGYRLLLAVCGYARGGH